MKFFCRTILFILVFFSVNSCFSQGIFKFQVQYMYNGVPDIPGWEITPKEWYGAGRQENHFIEFDMVSKVINCKYGDNKRLTILISDIDKKSHMAMDSAFNIQFEFLTSKGEKTRCFLYKDPSQSGCEKCFTFISYGKERECKFILEFIPAIL